MNVAPGGDWLWLLLLLLFLTYKTFSELNSKQTLALLVSVRSGVRGQGEEGGYINGAPPGLSDTPRP